MISLILLFAAISDAPTRTADTLRLHPENPHYFLFRGKPTILITSAEHYGAVINLDFDYVKYLDALAGDGMNHTRIWVGAYCEPEGALQITRNALAPAPGRFICPWARSDQPGFANGGNKFDLSRFDETYFARLRDFITQAARRGIVVEVNLFCPFYFDDMWNVSPMNAANNVNRLGQIPRESVYTIDNHGGLLAVQEDMVRRVVAELKDFDNIFYEVMNEPYVCNVPMDWQLHMLEVLSAAQREAGSRHLVSMNIANFRGEVTELPAGVSILNFHYAWPPDAVAMNYRHNVVIGENETGGHKLDEFHFRREGWAFILAGGGLYNNLDYSFTVGHEDGTFQYPPEQPGGGSARLRRELAILSRFINAFEFIRMKPASVVAGELPEDLACFALAEQGRQYAAYFCRLGKHPPADASSVQVPLELAAGNYRADWLNPTTGQIDRSELLDHPGGVWRATSPRFHGDVALRIVSNR